jgi:hypothetical protein
MLKNLIILVTVFFCSISYAQTVSEDDVKAAFLFHFISFTEWQDNEEEYYVCIPDDRSLNDAAQRIFAGKTINNRKVIVVDRATSCHVLVSNSIPYTHTMLTVGPLNQGALLEFRVVDNKLKFAINMEKIKNSRLKISSQLLKLAILE